MGYTSQSAQNELKKAARAGAKKAAPKSKSTKYPGQDTPPSDKVLKARIKKKKTDAAAWRDTNPNSKYDI